MINGRWGAKLLVAFFVIFSALLFNVVGNSQTSFAAYCSASRVSCNSPEAVARDACNSSGYSGAMWFNTSDSSQTDSGYYSATVNVNATANSVRVNLRGSVNSCDSSNNGNTVYAIRVESQGPNAGRLTNLDSQTLNRGTVPNARYSWSSIGGSIGADLNVSGLATNNIGRQDSQSITIDIYRCFSSNPPNVNGSCYATPVEVNVVRDAGPDFNLVPTISGTPSFIESGSASANTVTLAPSVNNTGSTTSTSAPWKIVTFNLAPSAGIPSGGVSGAAPEQFFGNNASAIKTGTDAFVKNMTPLPSDPQVIGDLPIGTRVCYALSVQPVTQSNGSWSHSTPFCVTIGKAPKVQILGNDLMVGRLFAGATIAVPSSKIQTSITKKAAASVTITAPQSAFGGLWKTGVDETSTKLGENQPDTHWDLDRIIRTPGSTGPTCQKAVGLDGKSLISVPTTSASPRIAPRTIVENSNNTKAGMYTNDHHDVTGDVSGPVAAHNGEYVWEQTSPYARWISQNTYGQNYNNPDDPNTPANEKCYDPTNDNGEDSNLPNANIYVFKLKDGFTIDPAANVDLDSAKIHIEGGVDNRVKFIVNGQELGDWQNPGWRSDSKATSDSKAGVFKNGSGNTLEVWVQSTASLTGLLIDKLTIEATAQVPQANMYGSWTEYLATATGPITGIGSGSAYAGGVPTQTVCGASLLTLSNTITADACSLGSPLGGYKTNKMIPDVASTFATNSATPTLPSQNLTGLNGLYKASGDFAITGGDIGLGKSVIINAPTSTVTITGDIKYSTSAMTSINNIPQVIIIAKNIMINGVNENGAVKQVDAWLIASDTINTCADAGTSASLTINRCKARLTVNGPVMANKLLLWRTGGSEAGAAAGDPAEVFNFRPDAYLWGISQSLKSGRLETVSERELPPRY